MAEEELFGKVLPKKYGDDEGKLQIKNLPEITELQR